MLGVPGGVVIWLSSLFLPFFWGLPRSPQMVTEGFSNSVQEGKQGAPLLVWMPLVPGSGLERLILTS